MKTLNLSRATDALKDDLEMSDREPLIIKIDDKPKAVLMTLPLADEITQSFNCNPEFIDIMQTAKAGHPIRSDSRSFAIEAMNWERSLGDYVEKIGDRPLIFTVDGKPEMVLIPIRDADMETASLSLSASFIEMLEESRERLKKEGGISLQQLAQESSEIV